MPAARRELFIEQWKARQRELRERMIVEPLEPLPRFVAGADAAFSVDKTQVFAAAVVYDRAEQRVIEVAHAVGECTAPYVPGFLTFREGPTVRAAIEKLTHPFGVICFDGHGYAHPRRCGLASHLSIELDVPGVGIAKSRFIGEYDDPAPPAGSSAPLTDKGEPIGLVLRTQDNVNPVFVSIGHRVDLASAAQLAIACCTRYRIPEPTRQADIEVARLKKSHTVTG
jgi:deoxyribonuclease V